MEPQKDTKCDLVIACIGNSEFDDSILNTAYKKSRLSSCQWRVLHVENKKSPNYSNKNAERRLKKAAILNAQVVTVPAGDIAAGIIEYAKTLDTKSNDVVFVIGDTKGQLLRRYSRNIYHQIKEPLAKLGIKIQAVQHEKTSNRNFTFISPIFNFDGLSGILEALICILVAFLACFGLQLLMPQTSSVSNYFLIYLTACIISSARGGLIPGLTAAFLSVLSIDFFFLKPEHTVYIGSNEDVGRLLFFLVVAVTVSLILSGTRRYIIESKQKEAYLNALLNVSETLNRPLNETEAFAYIHHELEKLFHTEIAFYTPALMDKSKLEIAFSDAPPNLSEVDKKALETCASEFRTSGYLTSVMPNAKWYFEPMVSASGFQGVLAIKLSSSPRRYDNNVIGILLGFADLSATIIYRIEHTQMLEANRITEEKEKLRTMLLSSVSHDLKTPLASIIGSLDVYKNLAQKLTPEAKAALIQTALQEAQRLDSFITNILDMAKLESGSVKFNRDWYRIENLMDRALNNSRSKLGLRETKHITSNNYEVEIDYNMMLRALANLFDNISKYTPDDSTVSISYGPDQDGSFSILIRDTGPGIAEDMLEQIFNKYTRIKKQDTIVAGTGLGLPISKSIIESHGGHISAYNNASPLGTSFKITLPSFRFTDNEQEKGS